MSEPLDPNHPDWKSFVLAMRCDQGRDDTPRLVFADWLDEEYPGNSFAPLIRLMIETERKFPDAKLTVEGWDLPDLGSAPLVKQPLGWMEDTWMRWPPLKAMLVYPGLSPHSQELARMCEFRRGFPDRLVLPWDRWMRDCDTICAIGPVGDVVLIDHPGTWVQGGQSMLIHTPYDRRLIDRLPERSYSWCYRISEWATAPQAVRDDFPRVVCENVLRKAFVESERVRSIRIDVSLFPN